MPEQQNIEYKQSWRDEYLKWICGFANAQGGKIFIGLDDSGKVVGIEDYKKLMEDLPNKITAHLGLMADVNLHYKNKKRYIEIVVLPSTVPISYHGAYHYRSGSTKQELKGTALHDFLLKKIGKTWDEIPVMNASLDNINGNTLNTFLFLSTESKRISTEAATSDIKTLFVGMNLLSDEGQLNHAGVLLFYQNPLKYFPTAYFKIGRFGKSDSDLKFQDIVEGNILDMPDKVIEILRSKYLTSPIRYEGLLRKEELEYPEVALREAILNAIVHKDYTGPMIQLSVYDDKLMLWNPGSLPDDVRGKLKDKHPSRPRNTNIAEVFFKAGYIEVWGRGISKMMDACKAAGLPEPDIREDSGGIWVTFLKDIFTLEYLQKLGLNDRQIESVKHLKEFQKITNKKYQDLFGVSRETASRDLANMVELGIVAGSGSKGAGSYFMLKK